MNCVSAGFPSSRKMLARGKTAWLSERKNVSKFLLRGNAPPPVFCLIRVNSALRERRKNISFLAFNPVKPL